MRRLVFIVLLLVAVTAIAAFIASRWASPTKVEVPPAPTPTQQATWKGVAPGSSFGDLIAKLGQPQKTEVVSGGTQVFYPGVDKNWGTEVAVKNNTVAFIREHVFPPQDVSLAKRTQQLGETPVRLYGNISESNMFLFVFPAHGVAFIASERNDTVYEVWYFQPAPIETLLTMPELHGYSPNPQAITGGR
ncbi:hypothetical protein HY031_01005 [Candidatus Gottesmanbacteria bacterium]|nr:hypothetical protein [Candidatus Gottesmanbacteria bacterium]